MGTIEKVGRHVFGCAPMSRCVFYLRESTSSADEFFSAALAFFARGFLCIPFGELLFVGA